ncbi:MAG TPA: DUF928 domain-containing protein [Stellaceae bacterium]|nr:DUF928 domain-containing protein [Stellaceae bacterium]
MIKILAAAMIAALVAAPLGAALAQSTGDTPSYKPPLRGAPGGRVGGASRGATAGPPLVIDLIAPDSHTGLTTKPSPTLYFFVSRPVSQPLTLTISAPGQARPLVESSIQPPRGAGIQAVRLSDYRVQLQPGVNYSWSVSLAVDPRSPSLDVVATASIMLGPNPAADSAALAAPPQRRAAIYAGAGLWYDAVAAAVDAETVDRHASLDALLDQVGLTEPATVDRQMAGTR